MWRRAREFREEEEEEEAKSLCSHLLVAPRESSQRKARISPVVHDIIKFRAIAKTQPPSFSSFLVARNEWKRDYFVIARLSPKRVDLIYWISDNFSIATINIHKFHRKFPSIILNPCKDTSP